MLIVIHIELYVYIILWKFGIRIKSENTYSKYGF